MSRRSGRASTAKSRKANKRKEVNWNNFSKPISKINEAVHSYAKIPFERV